MTSVVNQSKFPVQGFESRFYHGIRYHCVSAKLTFQWDEQGKLTLLKRQAPFVLNEIWKGEENRSSLLHPGDLLPFKPTTDVFVTGTARPPEGAQRVWAAALKVGAIEKRLRLFGPRYWMYQPGRGWTLTEPEPTAQIELLYENAFGGNVDPKKEHYEEGEYYPPNPIGKGFFGPLVPEREKVYPAAQIEAWDAPLVKIGVEVQPGGLGPIPGHIPDRMQWAGTYDEEWKEKVAPNIPLDMDMRYWNAAPPDQQPAEYLSKGARIELAGLCRGGHLAFEIPDVDAAIVARYIDEERKSLSMFLDTVAIDLDTRTVALRYHRIVPFDDEIRHLNVYCALIEKDEEA